MSKKLKLRRFAPVALTLLASYCAFGQAQEENAYCAYQTEQALAQRTVLRTPAVVGGVAYPNTGTQPQLYWGVSSRLADYGRARLAMDIARKSCQSYRATTEATLHIQFALQGLERSALRHRVDLLQQALKQLDAIVKQDARLVAVKNVTRPILYSMQSLRAKLVADKMGAELRLASLYVPDNIPDNTDGVGLQKLVLEKQNRDSEAQKSIADLNRQSNWDVKLEAGARQRLTPLFRNSVEPYGEITFSYNFAGRASNQHLENAATAYADWKRLQEGDVAHSAHVLEQQVLQSISVQQAALQEYREQEKVVDGNLERLVGIDSSAAVAFGNQLDADKVLLQVEIRDADFRLQQLQDYLRNNF